MQARAVYDYQASLDDPYELSFKKGDLFDIIDTSRKWQWEVEAADHGRLGSMTSTMDSYSDRPGPRSPPKNGLKKGWAIHRKSPWHRGKYFKSSLFATPVKSSAISMHPAKKRGDGIMRRRESHGLGGDKSCRYGRIKRL